LNALHAFVDVSNLSLPNASLLYIGDHESRIVRPGHARSVRRQTFIIMPHEALRRLKSASERRCYNVAKRRLISSGVSTTPFSLYS
jgi:hypothetical protein